MRQTPVLLVLMVAQGCEPGFLGDEGKARFDSTLVDGMQPWSPLLGVLPGSAFCLTALDDVEQSPLAPESALSVTGSITTGPLQVESSEENRLCVRSGAAGDSRVDWTGTTADHFTVRTLEPSTLLLRDPVRAALQAMLSPPQPNIQVRGQLWPEVADPAKLYVGRRLDLGCHLQTSNAQGVGYAPGDVTMEGGDGAVETQGCAVRGVTGGRTVQLSVNALGVPLRQWTVVTTEDLTDVARVEMTAMRLDGPRLYGVKATALDQDGGVLLQPPVVWTHPGFVEDPLTRFSEDVAAPIRERPDVRMLQLDDAVPTPCAFLPDGGVSNPNNACTRGDAGELYFEATVGAVVGSAAGEIQVPVRLDPPNTGAPPQEPPSGGCGCQVHGSNGAQPGWLLCVGAVVLGRRLRRGRTSGGCQA